jgi:hypothetical protein
MGRVEDGEPVHHLRVIHRDGPRDGPAPVVTDQMGGLGPEFSDQAADVGRQQVDGIGLEALWLR